jgi:hypothetical protein
MTKAEESIPAASRIEDNKTVNIDSLRNKLKSFAIEGESNSQGEICCNIQLSTGVKLKTLYVTH